MMNSSLEAFRKELYGASYSFSSLRQSKMVGTSLPTMSLPIPHVKSIAKAHRNDLSLDPKEFPLCESVEMTLCFFIISLSRISSFKEQMLFLKKNLRYADSWIITDTLSPFIKKTTGESFLPYYVSFAKSRYEYERRFAYVYALIYKKDPISPYLNYLVFDNRYYVEMAQAWMMATFAIFHFDEIISFLKREDIPVFLRKKTISKMRDSYRISPEEKELAKKIRDAY